MLLEIGGEAYAVAVEKERIVRDASFFPVNERIGPFDVRPMTLRHYLMLRAMRSPLLGKALPSTNDLAAFLWVVSPDFSLCVKARNKFLKKCRRSFVSTRFFRQKKLKVAAEIINAARAYVDEAFQDAPPQTQTATFDKEYYSDAAAICARFARVFGWDDEAILDKPLKRLFQYLKEHRVHEAAEVGQSDKVILFNPSDSLLTPKEAQ